MHSGDRWNRTAVLFAVLVGCQEIPDQPAVQPKKADVENLLHPDIGPITDSPYRDLRQHTLLGTVGRATHPNPSPDGTWMVYASTETCEKPQIFMRSLNSASFTQLTHNAAGNLFPKISPNGKMVAFASDRGGNWDIYIIRIDAPAAPMQITNGPNDDIAPSWSPDGKRVVYCSCSMTGVWQIIIVDVATRVPTYIGPGLYPVWSPHSKPEDQWIAFQSQPRFPGDKSGIWVMRPDGTELSEVAADRGRTWSAVTPSWSPDGIYLAYATTLRSLESRVYGEADQADDVYVIKPDGSWNLRLTRDLSPEWWPAWGGNRISFVSVRDGAQNIFSVRPMTLDEEESP